MIFTKVESYREIFPDTKCVLLDGCFDPVHHGHIRQLRTVRAVFHDHAMVVGVASDADIRLKGREPLFGQMTRCAIVDGLQGVDVVFAKERPLSEMVEALKPVALVKGTDWHGRLPGEVVSACTRNSVRMEFVGDVIDSSSDRLRLWALADADASLDQLEKFSARQIPATAPWQPVTDYSFDARKEIEGPHPHLIKEVFQPKFAVDAGCGPGHLVRLLNAIGVRACGFDLHPPDGFPFFRADLADPDDVVIDDHEANKDLVINRECLEHMTVQQIPIAVRNLFRLSSRFVYITTRFSRESVFSANTDFDTDPTHITCLSQPFLRSLCVLNGGKRRRDLETKLDHMGKGRVLVYEVQ